ncbi:hypothetical protein ACHOLT_12110 [Desulfitobacterium sp. Sab5]|uniref:hypothetical protein n=1 Tax=Desulfitobacterium nosdiversum TaxID=3375356 RepID=UPI003CE7DA3F
MNEHLFKMIFYFETDAISEFDVIQWAMNQYVNGNNTESMMQLASITKNDKDKVRTLLEQSLKDLGFDYPSKQSLGFYRAKLVSHEIIKGKLLPERGCRIIGRIGSNLEWPVILKEFGLLNKQLTDHENMQLTQEELSKAILSSANKLIDNVNAYLNLKDK